mmetsp:Transcript_11409/g.27799  ORF Transcript_11409/g.27799 Transcript_11409/m.27799 type:complete len:664 (-) Transcript_11409:333-2324(-)
MSAQPPAAPSHLPLASVRPRRGGQNKNAFEACGDLNATCACEGVVRFGYYLDGGVDGVWTGLLSHCERTVCAAENFPGAPTSAPAGALSATPVCECAAKPSPPVILDADLDFKFCAQKGENCTVDAPSRIRYGHSGLARHYSSPFFKDNPEVLRWVNANDNVFEAGVYVCGRDGTAEMTPWKGVADMADLLMCQVALLPPPDPHACVLAPPSPDATPSPFPPPGRPETASPKELAAVKAGEASEEASEASYAAHNNLPGIKAWEVKWKYCSKSGEECECDGTVRFGHGGMAEHYADGGAYFKEHPEAVRWLMRDVEDGAIGCNSGNFGDKNPFPDVPNKVCQCAAGVRAWQLSMTGVVRGTRAGSYGGFYEPMRVPNENVSNAFEHCGKVGEFCACDGGEIRIGHPGDAMNATQLMTYWERVMERPDSLDSAGRWMVQSFDNENNPKGKKGGVKCDVSSFTRDGALPFHIRDVADDTAVCQCCADCADGALGWNTVVELDAARVSDDDAAAADADATTAIAADAAAFAVASLGARATNTVAYDTAAADVDDAPVAAAVMGAKLAMSSPVDRVAHKQPRGGGAYIITGGGDTTRGARLAAYVRQKASSTGDAASSALGGWTAPVAWVTAAAAAVAMFMGGRASVRRHTRDKRERLPLLIPTTHR